MIILTYKHLNILTLKKYFWKNLIVVIGMAFLPLMVNAQTVDITLGPNFPIDEKNFLPGEFIIRSFSIENKTDEDQNVMLKMTGTYGPVDPPIEERIIVTIKRFSDGASLALPAKTLREFYNYQNPDSDYENAFYFDTLPGGIGNTENYEIFFTFDSEAGNEYQNKGEDAIKTIFDLSTGIAVSSEEGSAPEAVDDYYEIGMDDTENLGILFNDRVSDSPLDLSSIEIVNNPVHASLTVYTSGGLAGVVAYNPENGYEGDDSFTYRVKDLDGDLSNTATVEVKIEDDDDGDNDDDGDGGGDATLAGFTPTGIILPGTTPSGGVQGEQEIAPEVEEQAASTGEEEGGKTEVGGAQKVCNDWPWWVWALILAGYLALFYKTTFTKKNKQSEKIPWGWQAVMAAAAVVFWWYFDTCRDYLWFLYGSLGGSGLEYVIFLWTRNKERYKKIKEEQKNS